MIIGGAFLYVFVFCMQDMDALKPVRQVFLPGQVYSQQSAYIKRLVGSETVQFTRRVRNAFFVC